MAPTTLAVALEPPGNELMLGLGGVGRPPVVPAPPVLLVAFEPEELRTKFAQVRRVALEVWNTIERLPRNAPGPCLVDRYKSEYLCKPRLGRKRQTMNNRDVRCL